MSRPRIGVLRAGHVGLVTAACLAAAQHLNALFIDIDVAVGTPTTHGGAADFSQVRSVIDTFLDFANSGAVGVTKGTVPWDGKRTRFEIGAPRCCLRLES